MSKHNKKPSLRFKGFSEEWETRKLEQIVEYTSSSLSVGDAQSDGKYNLYDANDLIGKTNKDPMKSKYITVIKDGAGVGRVRILPENTTFIGTMGALTTRTNNLNFIYQHLLKRDLSKSFSGSTIPHIYFKDYGKEEYLIPSKNEQQKIADFLTNLDSLLTLQQRRVEKLVATKSALLEKMFPRNGATTPEIRFHGFNEDWETKRLGEVADIVGGGTPSTNISEYWDGDIDWYAPAEIADQIFLNGSQRKITLEGYNNSSAKLLPAGTVLFTSRAGIGKTGILCRKGCTNQGFQSIVPHFDTLDSYFILTRSEELKQYGETVGAGSTFVEVSGKQMANMELMMPTTLDEQKAIAELFRNLDSLISLHQRKIEKLQNIKKSLLEKMFV